MAEWIELGEALHRHAEKIRREAREVLANVVAELGTVETESKIEKLAVDAAALSIQRDWHVVDEKMQELVGQVTDELATFVTVQEIRVRSLDRRLQSERDDSGSSDTGTSDHNRH
ncbi:MAG: hypothetical protein ACR2QV_08870 [Gammaproteobacteria bacterium]